MVVMKSADHAPALEVEHTAHTCDNNSLTVDF
jgi:hypothetical protein